MRVSREQLEQIKNSADIVDVISQYVELSPKGNSYIGLCPFHDDHNASMHVNAQKQFYKCFSCGAGGDVFGFVKDIEGIDFLSAVQKVAGMVNIPLTIRPVKESPFKKEREALSLFNRYCHYLLKSQQGQQALNYLKGRNFSEDLIERFELGYAPQSEQSLKFFKAHKTDPLALYQSGLSTEKEGSFSFYERITIPIHDPHGNPVGLSARILPGREGPKYINTRATRLFDKSATIFNYHRALPEARKSGRLILVEGAMDVLGLEKAGFHEGIACLGTALTGKQLDLIKQAQVPVIVLYDNDPAGQKAAYRFGQMALKNRIPFSIAHVIAGKDPDECFDLKGKEGLETSLNASISFLSFCFGYFKESYNLSNFEDKRQYAAKMADLIAQADPAERLQAYRQLYKLTGFDYRKPENNNDLSSQYEIPELPQPEFTGSYPQESYPVRKKRRPNPKRGVRMKNPPLKGNSLQECQRLVLFWLLKDRHYMDYFNQELGFLPDEPYSAFCDELSYYYSRHFSFEPKTFLAQENCSQWLPLLGELEKTESSQDEKEFLDAIVKLKEKWFLKREKESRKQVLSASDLLEQIKSLQAQAETKKEHLELRKPS